MLKVYSKIVPDLFVGGVRQKIRRMKNELFELRYFLEKNVKIRTEPLLKRIAMLESCNVTLGEKLVSSQQENSVLRFRQKNLIENVHDSSSRAVNSAVAPSKRK